MKKTWMIRCVLLSLLTLIGLWALPALAGHHMQADDAAKKVYVCGCGPKAGCDMLAGQPGTAPCGKPLLEKPVLKEDADKIYVCACSDDCTCQLDAADPARCACGKALRAYPKDSVMGCAHGMQPGHGCDKCDKCDKCRKKANCEGCPKPSAPAQ